VLQVRRSDDPDWFLLHVQGLRDQHGLQLAESGSCPTSGRAARRVRRLVVRAYNRRAVEIEERLLQFSSEAPLRAWRLFRVRHHGDGIVLSSPMFHNPHPVPWPESVAEATCHEGHSAPAPACRCGIYGAVRGTLDSLPGYLVDTAYERDPWAYAEIGCSGLVFVDMRGVRAERAEILRLALPAKGASPATSRLLAERYGVPVGGIEDVPEWVIRNVRNGGSPPHDLPDLDLDALELHAEPR
jgi:hypothetical protein